MPAYVRKGGVNDFWKALEILRKRREKDPNFRFSFHLRKKGAQSETFTVPKENLSVCWNADDRVVGIVFSGIFVPFRRSRRKNLAAVLSPGGAFRESSGVFRHEARVQRTVDGRWYLVLLADRKRAVAKMHSIHTAVGIDPGVRTFLTTFSPVESLKIGEGANLMLEKCRRAAARLQRKEARDGDRKRRKRLRHRFRVLWAKVRERVGDLHRKAACLLCAKYSVVFLPHLATSRLSRRFQPRKEKKG